MAGKFAILQKIEQDHTITAQTDPIFLHRVKRGLLLALLEQGLIGITQYRLAEEKLENRWRVCAGRGENL